MLQINFFGFYVYNIYNKFYGVTTSSNIKNIINENNNKKFSNLTLNNINR